MAACAVSLRKSFAARQTRPYLLCDLGKVTSPIRASVSSSMKWGFCEGCWEDER